MFARAMVYDGVAASHFAMLPRRALLRLCRYAAIDFRCQVSRFYATFAMSDDMLAIERFRFSC
jgi:hypothetical protein